ncbi:MAG: hypothetical protein EXR69_14205 [Myxococcales bacterium]|nr:hypothetical protein [Myxococcales bacterium]
MHRKPSDCPCRSRDVQANGVDPSPARSAEGDHLGSPAARWPRGVTPAGVYAGVLAAVLGYDLARWQAVRVVRRRLNRSVEGFIQRHNVELDHFRFTDRIWVRQTLLLDPEPCEETAARARVTGVSLLTLRRKIDGWLHEIVPYFNILSYYKLGGAVAQAAANACYELVFDAASLEWARSQIPRGAVTVYVANHRSNADYVVLSVGAMSQVALSYAVGEWARVWPLDVLLRSFASYFVRWGEKDPLYHRVLERYLQLVAARWLTTAFFLEGGLSRDGRLREPITRLLDYLIGVLRREPDREIVYIPVGINYDRVLKYRNLLADKRPTGAVRFRSLLTLMVGAPGVLFALFGRAAVRSHRKQGYAAVTFGDAIRSFMPDAAATARRPDKERRPEIARATASHD